MTWDFLKDESIRRREFPVAGERIFLAHAGVAALPRAAADALVDFAQHGARDDQENAWAVERIGAARRSVAKLLGCEPAEVAMLGPTSLGINLIANGLPWEPGDEVVYYPDDYPANVYPWQNLAARGVKPVALRPARQGVITPSAVEQAITSRTKLVALASCNFLSGYRIDVDAIGALLQNRGILFSVDGIQTLGAFPFSVEHVDFLSADSHKWMLGPVGAGVFYVKASRQDLLKPTVLGSWNIVTPNYIAQPEIRFHAGSRRYEPGTFNVPGILGMGAAADMLCNAGIERIGARILELRKHLLDRLRPHGFRLLLEDVDTDAATPETTRSGIITLTHPSRDMKALAAACAAQRIVVSCRYNRAGEAFIRVSPHFYNTVEELDRLADILVGA